MNFLLISAHDYRSKRKANFHFIANELKSLGNARFFSVGFSWLSNLRGRDTRIGLESRANSIELYEDIECYLWRSKFHPFNVRYSFFRPFAPALFNLYRMLCPKILKNWAADSDVILIESGLGVLFIQDLRKWAPHAKIIYVASDDLKTIEVDDYLVQLFHSSSFNLDYAKLASELLRKSMPPNLPCMVVPHGIDHKISELGDPSPYGPGIHAVSVGSMLFDPSFFWAAAEAFPSIQFHVIGSGVARNMLPPRIVYYEELPFAKTIPFIKHADFAIAPYRQGIAPDYLRDTSMKLIQYEFFGLPSVCPRFVAKQSALNRFYYDPGDTQSIVAAINEALRSEKLVGRNVPSWEEVTFSLLNPPLEMERKGPKLDIHVGRV